MLQQHMQGLPAASGHCTSCPGCAMCDAIAANPTLPLIAVYSVLWHAQPVPAAAAAEKLPTSSTSTTRADSRQHAGRALGCTYCPAGLHRGASLPAVAWCLRVAVFHRMPALLAALIAALAGGGGNSGLAHHTSMAMASKITLCHMQPATLRIPTNAPATSVTPARSVSTSKMHARGVHQAERPAPGLHWSSPMP